MTTTPDATGHASDPGRTAATTGAAAPPSAPLGRAFGVHLTGVGIANLADGVMAAGLPLVAITLTRSPGEISLLQVALWLPWLLLGLLIGVVVDRVDRRRVQLVGMSVRAVLLGGLTWLAVTDRLSIWLLVAFALAYGITEVLVDLAASSMVPALVPGPRRSAANGRVSAVQQVGSAFVGAPVGGALLLAGTAWVVGIPALLCVAFVLLIGLGLRRPFRVERAAPVSVRADVADGLRFIWRHPVLRPNLVTSGLMNMSNTAYFSIFVLYAVGAGSTVGLRPEHYPLLVASLPVGAVLASVVVERLVRRAPEVRVMYTAWAVNSALLLVPVLLPTPAAIAAAMLGLGLTNTVSNVVGQTIRQRVVPQELLGRTGGAGRMIGYGLMPVGAFLGGQLAELVGIVPVLVGAAVLCLLSVAWVATRVDQALVDSLAPREH